MSTISTILSTLRSAVWAIDVRDEIANAIEQCYKDVNSPSLVTDGIEEVIGDMVDNGRISGAIVEDLGLITEGTSNLFDFTTVTAGRLNTSTGEVGEASGYWTSDFIPVENEKTYYFANTYSRVAYNSSQAYSANISGTTWTASANGYVRVSVTSANRKTAKINEGSAKDYRPGRSPIDFNLRDDVYRKAEVDAALAAVTIATDPELETAGAAADAKATGDAISALNESLSAVSGALFTQGDALTVSATSNGYALTGTGLATSNNSSKILKYSVTAGNTLYLSLSADNAGTYQFQSTASVPESGTNVNLIGNPVTGAVDAFVKVPTGATYLLVSQLQSNTTNVVTTASTINEDVEKIETLTAKLKNAALVAHDIDWADYSNVIGYINDRNVWQIFGTRSHVALDASGWERVKIKNEGSGPAYYAFLASYDGVTNGGTPDYSAGHARRYTLAAGETVVVDMPTDAAYLYVMTQAPSSEISRLSVTYYSIDRSDTSAFEVYKSKVDESLSKLWNAMQNSFSYGNSDSSIKDIPKNQGVRNAIKKIQQMNNIQYTTKGPIPYTGGGDYRTAGTTYTGLPYTIPVETQTMVGEDVSFETFMTAINNPYSVMYTENINGGHSASAIGNTYHGTNRGAYYGTMCSGLVWYALGMNPLQRYIDYLVTCGTMEYVYDNSATGVQLMDVLLLPKHFAIVYDITRDNLGEPTQIIVKEAWAQTILTRVYTPEEFNNRLGRTGKLGRYKDLYKNLEYTPSPFVAVGSETIDTPYAYNNDICTNYGDKAVINQGKYLAINYNLDGNTTGYTQMIVRQGNTNIQTYTLDANSHLINITALNLTPGLYTAVLSDGTTESEPTYFEIAHAEVTEVTIDGRIMTVKFATDYGTPQYVRTCDIEGMPLGFYELTEDDITAGECSFDYVKLYNTQFPEYTWPAQPYVRVCNVNEYGKMSSDMVAFTV